MSGAEPRDLRDYFTQASLDALACANEERAGLHDDPVAAGGVRLCSAALKEIRDALEVRASWLADFPQVSYMLLQAMKAAKYSTFRMDFTVYELATMLRNAVTKPMRADG